MPRERRSVSDTWASRICGRPWVGALRSSEGVGDRYGDRRETGGKSQRGVGGAGCMLHPLVPGA
jgi:hypothetical protein